MHALYVRQFHTSYSVSQTERIPPYVRHDNAASWDEVPTELVVVGSTVGQTEGSDAHPPKGLLDDCVQIRQRVPVTEVGKTVVANDSVQLRMRLPLYIGIEGHSETECLESGSGLRRNHGQVYTPNRQRRDHVLCRTRLNVIQ